MTYLDIVETLESVSGGIDLIPDVRLMIDNYIAIIRRDIVDDQQLIEICDKYTKTSKALDLIFEHRVNNRGQIAAAVRETLQQMSDEGSIVLTKIQRIPGCASTQRNGRSTAAAVCKQWVMGQQQHL